MTAFIWQLSEDRVLILCDTLVSDPVDNRPLMMTTKTFLASHIGTLVCGTGLADLAKEVYLATLAMVAKDVAHLDEFTPAIIAGKFASMKAAIPSGVQESAIRGTVYTFGWIEEEKRFAGFAYRSTNNFASERLSYGLAVKPPPSDASVLENIDSFDKLVRVMHAQKSEDRAKPRLQRVGIGGDIFLYLMQRTPDDHLEITVRHVERFEDFNTDIGLALCKLPQNRDLPLSRLALATDP